MYESHYRTMLSVHYLLPAPVTVVRQSERGRQGGDLEPFVGRSSFKINVYYLLMMIFHAVIQLATPLISSTWLVRCVSHLEIRAAVPCPRYKSSSFGFLPPGGHSQYFPHWGSVGEVFLSHFLVWSDGNAPAPQTPMRQWGP